MVLRETGDAGELTSRLLIYDIMGRSERPYGFSADPLPLSDMLASEPVRDAVAAYHVEE
jgi:hypothetical protein